MAYKNTAGTTSIANEMGTWRYFSSGLAKLGEYKGASLNIPEKSVQPEERNWAESLMHAFKGIGEATETYFKAETDRKYKIVDEYLQQHSLEDYQRDIQDHSVPFQDDPIAMSRLKYMHGKMAYSIAKQDFEREVIDKNLLKDMSPEQIDAEAFRYFQESKSDMLEAFGYDDSDEYFRRGFYETSPQGRVGFIAKAQEVDNNEKTQASILAESANFSALINDPNANYKSIVGVFDQVYDTVGVHYTPDQQKQLIDNMITMVSKRSDGVQLLEQLGDYTPPYAKNGESLKNIMGELAWGKAKAQARATMWTRDAEVWGEDHRRVEAFVNEGNYQTIDEMAQWEAQSSGGALSDRYKWLIQAGQRARTQADRLIAQANRDAEKQAKDAATLQNGNLYIDALKTGGVVYKPDILDLSSKDIDKIFASNVESGAYTTEDIFQIASNPSGGYNPAKAYLSAEAKKVMSSLTGDVRKLTESKVSNVKAPQQLDMMLSLYKAHPDSFELAFGDMKPYERNLVRALVNSISTGSSYEDCIRAASRYQELSSTADGRHTIQAMQDNISNDLDISFNDKYSKTVAFNKALSYSYFNEDMSDAVDKAKKDMEESNVKLMGSYIPNSLFSVPNASFSDVQEYTEKLLEAAFEKNKWTVDKDVIVGYNPQTDTLDVYDITNGRVKFRVDNKFINDSYKSYIDERAKNPAKTYGQQWIIKAHEANRKWNERIEGIDTWQTTK